MFMRLRQGARLCWSSRGSKLPYSMAVFRYRQSADDLWSAAACRRGEAHGQVPWMFGYVWELTLVQPSRSLARKNHLNKSTVAE